MRSDSIEINLYWYKCLYMSHHKMEVTIIKDNNALTYDMYIIKRPFSLFKLFFPTLLSQKLGRDELDK